MSCKFSRFARFVKFNEAFTFRINVRKIQLDFNLPICASLLFYAHLPSNSVLYCIHKHFYIVV